MKPHLPEKCLGALKTLELLATEYVVCEHFFWLIDRIKIFADPVERLQIAQAALAIFHVRLDEIATFALPEVTFVPFRELRRDKLQSIAAHSFLTEEVTEFLIELGIAPHIACFQQRGGNGDIPLRKTRTLVERARGMA